jgi:penicillin-binding protein 1A
MNYLALAFVAGIALLAACESPDQHVNAFTLQSCKPNQNYQPKQKNANHQNDKCQGNSNGDNCDDLSSGKVDCIGDGNSGQGDDKKHNCMFPQPGCDDAGCCDDDMVDPNDDDGDGGDTGGGDTGGGDTGGGGGDTGPVVT